MILDNLNSIKPENSDSSVVNEAPAAKKFLKFEIAEEAPAINDEPRITVEKVDTEKEENTAKNDGLQQPKEEFDIPDSFETDEVYASASFVQTPSAIRPTYLPRFTEVSETYRMQNDPRPRPTTDARMVKADKDDPSLDLDPTTERLEDKDVKKVVVTSKTLRNSEPKDENLTVLKFSTPIETETRDAFEPETEPETIAPEPEMTDPIIDEDPDIIQLDGEILEDFDEYEPTPKNMTIPDPDATFRVVDFAKREISAYEEPQGASDSEKKEKVRGNAEFNSPIQRDGIKDRFLDTLMSIRVRLVGTLVLLCSMALIDVLPSLGVDVFKHFGFGNVPYANAIIDMMFSVCIFLFALPEVLGAIKMLFKGKFTPELFAVLSLALIVANDLIVSAVGATSYLTFGVLYGLQCFAIVYAAYNKAASDFTSFKLVSRNVAKNVIDKRLTRELPHENLALDGAVDEYSSKTARMFRTVFVSNFFKRSSESCENFVNTAMMMGISFGVSLVTGIVSFLLNGYSLVSGIQSATAVIMLSLPVFSILAHKLPYRHACNSAASEESAFVGESSIYEGADIDVITYEDTEIFGIEDVSLRKVHLYGKVYNTPKAMKQMYSLFSVVGGPLDFLFSSALDRKCSPAQDVVIEDNGVSGMLDGQRICAGTEEYMKSHGISIPEDDFRTNPASNDSTKVMYGAEDGEVYVKFFIRYSFSEEFTMLLPDLKARKIVPLVYTRDPNITADLLKVLTLGEDIIRVMKKYIPRSAEEKTYRRVDSGIVTHGDKGNAINMILLAKKYASFQTSLEATELIFMAVGAALAVFLAIGGMMVVPATVLALWQVGWCAVLSVRSKLHFRHRTEKEEEQYE